MGKLWEDPPFLVVFSGETMGRSTILGMQGMSSNNFWGGGTTYQGLRDTAV